MTQLAAPTEQQIKTGQYQDASVTGAKIAAATIPNADLAADVFRQNLLVNGGFENWQRGVGPFSGGPFTSYTGFTADRWQRYVAGSDVLTVSQVAGDTTLPGSGNFAVQFAYTAGGASGTSFYQRLTKSDGNQLSGRALTISAMINCNTPNAIGCYIQSDGTGGVITKGATNTGTGWQLITVTYTPVSDMTYVHCGLFFNMISCSAIVDNIMLVYGSVPCTYMPMHPADDLARCLRYYEIQYPELQAYVNASGNQIGSNLFFAVVKALSPTITKTGAFSFGGTVDPQSPIVGVRAINGAVHGYYYYLMSNGVGICACNATATSYITAEANP
jgi:hypothetical protein